MLTETIPVLIAEDQLVMRAGLRAVLQQIPGVQIVGEAGDGQIAVKLANELHPAIIFMDVNMPHMDGIAATRAIKGTLPDVRIIMFTSNDEGKALLDALSAGADGYCLKNSTEKQLAGAISAVLQGATWLDAGVASQALRNRKSAGPNDAASDFSTAQQRILDLVVAGMNLDQIAVELSSPIAALKVELKTIIEKLQGTQDEPTSASTTYRRLRSMLDSAKHAESEAPTLPKLQAPDDQIGQILDGKYIVESVIGEGGMSMVYRARHMLMDKTVAVKMLHRHLLADSSLVKRLQNEARAAGSISHPNIVAVHDFGLTASGRPYLVMDYVSGETLAEMLQREQKLPLKLCMEILIQVCDALSMLHGQGIIHRDLKSSNIMLVQEKGKLVAKLLDFGIAKTLTGGTPGNDLTLTGEIFGSPAYMSPEQCLGHPVDFRSDLYSMGCILYQLLTGNMPFNSTEPLNTMWQQVHEQPSAVPFLNLNNGMPLQLRTVLFQLLSKEPDMRIQSADRLKFEFETILNTLELRAINS